MGHQTLFFRLRFSGFRQSYKRPCLFRSFPSICVQLAHDIISIYSFLGMCGWCCPICLNADSAQKMGESNCFYLFLGCCFGPCIPTFLIRNKARQIYGLEGSSCKYFMIRYLILCNIRGVFFKLKILILFHT